MANSDVKLRHKVQLRKKVEEPKVAVETEGADTGNIPTPDKSGSKKWLWIFLSVIVLCVIGYFIFSKSGDTTVTEQPEQGTEIVEQTIVTTDSLANQEEATEEGLTADENEVSNNTDNQEPKLSEASNIATTTTSTASNAIVSNDVEAEAMKVIRGDYGVGQERKEKLGTKYQTIQSRVNELKREGIF